MIDVKKNEEGLWSVYVKGGREKINLDVIEWVVKGVEFGVGEIVVNSMDEDGMKNGYDIELLLKIIFLVNVFVIVFGGVGKKEDFYEVVNKFNVDGILVVFVFYFGEIKINDLKKYLKDMGVEVRL